MFSDEDVVGLLAQPIDPLCHLHIPVRDLEVLDELYR